ncbi:MAG: tRNA (adenosine(37)-N6)-dimethylallyltransferase MiaA [Patescibacteria group bacterium]|nr:tRNA (adenosine(37)-N6)-dimethylallyltransferase MiaA [Patescibacteria group bacterium]
MTYNIITIGCQMNRADSERLSFYLEKLGFLLEPNFSKADLVVIVSCGVKQSAEDRVYGLAHRIMKGNKKAIIALTGCLSDREDVKSRLAGNAKIFFNISDLMNLDKSLKKYFPKIKKIFKQDFKNYLEISPNRFSSFSALVPIGNGCNNFCSYCVVPYARGREIYRPAKDIISEIEALVKVGYKEINLIAQNVNSYKSGKLDFPTLLKKIDKIPGNFWLRFSTSHPKDVSPGLIKVLKENKKICEHFHLAVQSGDDKILQAMNRKYKINDYINTVRSIRKSLDYKNGLPAAITTDIIVGFPGEGKSNFNNTKNLFRKVKFDLAYISKYSPRFGTASFELKDDINLEEKKRREAELNILLRKYALENNNKYLDKELDVLIEGVDKKGNLFGRTRTSKIVRIKKASGKRLKEKMLGRKKVCIENNCADRKLIGEFVKVKINQVKEFELEGELIKSRPQVLVILGPTASGKTALAVKLAHDFNGEIVSADSRQVYRGMDVGTGKDLAGYSYKGKDIPYHLIDVCSPKNVFSLAKYQKMAFSAIDNIISKGKLPILVGGSGLYLEAVIDNYILSAVKPIFGQRDEYENLSLEQLHSRIKKINPKFFKGLNNSERNNKRRLARFLEVLLSENDFSPKKGEPRYDFLIFGLSPDREVLRERIYKRLIKRLEEEDMIGEVERLKKSGVSYKRLESFGLEYRFIAYYLQKKITYQQLIDKLFIAICQFSKKQMSWFRRSQKQGMDIVWVEGVEEVKNSLESL